MSDFQHLAQWAEPDGDHDELENVRLDIRTLLAEYGKAHEAIEELLSSISEEECNRDEVKERACAAAKEIIHQ